MPQSLDRVYCYDGSFEGLLTAVFESYERKETPLRICPEEGEQTNLFPTRQIPTDDEKAARVLRGVRRALSGEAADLLRLGFLTCLEGKELAIYRFIRKGMKLGSPFLRMLADDDFSAVNNAVGRMNCEAHLFKGFLRFSEYNGMLAAKINPENFILPILAPHFCDRYRNEAFAIFDETNGAALIYRAGQRAIVPAEELTLPPADEKERALRALWKQYYNTIGIEGRYNPKCRMTMMPKRYWKFMTEFLDPEEERAPRLNAPDKRSFRVPESSSSIPEHAPGGGD